MSRRHIAVTWTFRFGGANEIRVEESPRTNIDATRAGEIAQHIRDTQGTLCAKCHRAARFRIVHVAEPDVPRCWDCNEGATQSYGARE